MAGGPAKEGGHPAMDYAAHDRTYEGFIHFSMIGTLYCVAVLVCMAIYFTGKSAFWGLTMALVCTAGALAGCVNRTAGHWPISIPLGLALLVWGYKVAVH